MWYVKVFVLLKIRSYEIFLLLIIKLMQYPLISEYLAAIREANDNLDKLSHLVPVLDKYGEPYRSSGAFAVVFKMKD